MEPKIHEYQISILRVLLFNPKARFRDLNKVNVTNDHFTFHVNHLLEQGLIVKKDGRYSLSDKGKEFSNRMDTDTLKLERQAKLAVALHPVRIKNDQKEYLVHKRLKQPFYGWYGSHSGKISWGENPLQAAQRELLEETNLTGKFTLKAIVHYHHYHKDGRFLEDKYFWVYKITSLKGELKQKVEEGENIWMTGKEYKKLKNVFSTFEENEEQLNSRKLSYIEKVKTVDSY